MNGGFNVYGGYSVGGIRAPCRHGGIQDETEDSLTLPVGRDAGSQQQGQLVCCGLRATRLKSGDSAFHAQVVISARQQPRGGP